MAVSERWRARRHVKLDVEVIEAELAKLAEQPIEKDWRSAPLAEIIDHIIVRYHDRHREQLPELILQATKVERVHADKPSVPKGLTKYLTMLHEELSSHMMKEEQILFPMIKQGMGSRAMGPISVMESEHDEAGELLEVIKHTTNNVTPPPEACTTRKAMYNGINELIDDLMDHISPKTMYCSHARWRVSDLKAGWHCAIQHDNAVISAVQQPASYQ